MGSIDVTVPGPIPYLKIIALGPNNGGPATSTIQWLGAYNGQGEIAQNTRSLPQGFFYSGTASQSVPEPASVALLAMRGNRSVVDVPTPIGSLGRQNRSLDERRIDSAFDKRRVAKDVLVDRDRRFDSLDSRLRLVRRCMQAIASARVGWCTISLPIIES